MPANGLGHVPGRSPAQSKQRTPIDKKNQVLRPARATETHSVAFDSPRQGLAPLLVFTVPRPLEVFENPGRKVEAMDRPWLSFHPFDVKKVIHRLVEWRHSGPP